MHKKILGIAALFFLVGCAQVPDKLSSFEDWQASAKPNDPSADWKTYYQDTYKQIQSMPSFKNQEDALLAASVMINVSDAYQTKMINWHEFERNRRNMDAKLKEIMNDSMNRK
ncbi:MAG: hypothetical protein ACI4QS_12170 [Comamonas sp.]